MRIRFLIVPLIILVLSVLLFVIPSLYYPIVDVTVISGNPILFSDNSASPNVEFQKSIPYLLSRILHTFNIDSPPIWIFELSWFLLSITTAVFGIFTSGCLLFLYTRRKLSENPQSRHMIILDYIIDNPGAQEKAIIQATGYSRGSVSHHLRRLIHNLKIYKIEEDIVRYYPIGFFSAEKNDYKWKLLENENRKCIFQTILKNPGISQKHIAEKTHIPLSTIRWHLEKMLRGKLILVETNQHITRYSVNPVFIDENLSHVLDYAQYL